MNALQMSSGGFVGFKPRDVSFGRGTDGFNLFGSILTCEFMGADYMTTIDIGVGHIVIRNPERKIAGESVELYIPKDALYYFDSNQNRTDTVQTGEVVNVFHVDD